MTTADVVIPSGTVFAVDLEARTIRGRAMPYGVIGKKAGRRFRFSKGTIVAPDPSRVKMWLGHDKATACGVAFEITDTDDGLDVAMRVARGAEGDRALALADDGVWDAFSIGPSDGARYRVAPDGVLDAVEVPIHEISLTPAPVFGGARVHSVTFDIEESNPMPEPIVTEPETVEVPGTDFSALTQGITEALTAGFANLANPQGDGPTVVSAGASTAHVVEALPYRFDGPSGEFSLTDDMRSAQQGDSTAQQRFETFVEEAFAVATGNVSSLNPVQNRPELYVPNLTYSTPLWDAVSTGVITDRTPFTIPKFVSAGNLVNAHVEGVEPTPGTFVATSQTITPTALSGKVEINREVLDQGGTPQADGIIWGEMLNAWFEAREARVAAVLQAVGTAELNLAGAVDGPLVRALTNYFASLQFVRGGNRYTGLVLDGMLFPALVNAQDTSGRSLLPVLAPANAVGTTSGAFDRIQIGNQTGRAAWALGSTVASRSFNFVPSSVYAWASAPKRFTFEYQLKSVDMAIWGYAAGAILRDTDVKPIDYTTAD